MQIEMKEIHCYIRNSESSSRLLIKAERTHYKKKELKAQVIENGYVLVSKGWDSTGRIVSGGVVDKDGRYIRDSAYSVEDVSVGYDFNGNECDKSNECIFLGFFHLCYGHAITDALKKIWYLQTEEAKTLINKGCEVVFITTSNADIPNWHLHLLELAGVDITKCRHIRRTTNYNRIIVPDSSWWMEDDEIMYCDGFAAVINQIKENVKKTDDYSIETPAYVYFTRTALYDVWREVGESALERYFARKGYHVISPEKLTLERQISMLMKCKGFASTEGSCSHGEIFCNPDADVTILRKADYSNRYSTAIADFANCKTAFVDANHSILCHKDFPWRGPFYLTITKELREYTGLNGGLPYCLRLTYCLYKYQYTTLGKHLLFFYYLSLILRRKLKGLL